MFDELAEYKASCAFKWRQLSIFIFTFMGYASYVAVASKLIDHGHSAMTSDSSGFTRADNPSKSMKSL